MKEAIQELLNLLEITGPSTEETAVSEYVEGRLRAYGIPASAIRRDNAHEQSEYGGAAGNLIVRLPRKGGHKGVSRLLMAHLDTVALCRGARPRMVPASDGKPARIINENPESALGADCRTGVAALLNVARFLAAPGAAHPPVTLVFTVQEELGLIGARGLDLSALVPDPPEMGLNLDGHSPRNVIYAITGTTRFFIDIFGKAAHAGSRPEEGISTAAAAALALAELVKNGWHGPIEKPEGRGSANIGVIKGGEMTNTVMEKIIIRGEARSHDRNFRQTIVEKYRRAFEEACAATKNKAGESARMEWKLGPCYESFALPYDSPAMKIIINAIRETGSEPNLISDNGGSDANWLNAKGLPTVQIGVGQNGAHTIGEWVNLDDFQTACLLAERFAVA